MQEEGRQVVNGQLWHCQMYPPFVPNRQRREAGQADSDRIFGLEGGLLFSLPQLDLLPKGGHFCLCQVGRSFTAKDNQGEAVLNESKSGQPTTAQKSASIPTLRSSSG